MLCWKSYLEFDLASLSCDDLQMNMMAEIAVFLVNIGWVLENHFEFSVQVSIQNCKRFDDLNYIFLVNMCPGPEHRFWFFVQDAIQNWKQLDGPCYISLESMLRVLWKHKKNHKIIHFEHFVDKIASIIRTGILVWFFCVISTAEWKRWLMLQIAFFRCVWARCLSK